MVKNTVEITFLNILRNALRGLPADRIEVLSGDQWRELFHLAEIQKVLPLIFEAAAASDAGKQLAETDPRLYRILRKRIRQMVVFQSQRSAAFLHLLRQMAEEGLRPIVVKGIVCRSLYPKPDHRPSADEDLLLGEGEWEKVPAFLERNGFVRVSGNEEEMAYQSGDGSLYLELHRHLFAEDSEVYGGWNRLFAASDDVQIYNEKNKPNGIQRRQNGEDSIAALRVLNPQDHMLYLLCHALKHFLHSGFGIRQVADMVLYAEQYGAFIDWNFIRENCRQLNMDTFAAVIFKIGRKYLGMDVQRAGLPGEWINCHADETDLLTDLLHAGAFGSSDRERLHSSNITLQAYADAQRGESTKPLLMKTAARSFFLPAKQMEMNYPYLKGRPYLLPAAWVERGYTYLSEQIVRKNQKRKPKGDAAKTLTQTERSALQIGKRRVTLLEEYGLLGEEMLRESETGQK